MRTFTSFLLRFLTILLLALGLGSGCATHDKSNYDEVVSPLSDRSPAALGHQCRELVAKIWDSPNYQLTPEQASRMNRPTLELLEEEQAISMSKVDDFLSGHYRLLNDGEYGPLRRAFLENILPSTQEEQHRPAAGLLLLLKQRRPELSTSSLIAHYQRLMRSCI